MKDAGREHDLFGDYTPKETPDTVFDYLEQMRNGEKCAGIIRALPAAEIRYLKKLLRLFEEYYDETKINPGKFVEGNLILGAKERQYEPSTDELVLAEIGKKIKEVLNTASEEEIREHVGSRGSSEKKIEYNSFDFTHFDVMGSGRFFYASDPKQQVVDLKQKSM